MAMGRSDGNGPLNGTSVVIGGGGLAGLTAARALERQGADVHIVEARSRLGGRVWTRRDEALGGGHAESGGEFVDADHQHVRRLVRQLGLGLTPVLRGGFGSVTRVEKQLSVSRSQTRGWRELRRLLAVEIDSYREHCARPASSVGTALARRSLLDLLRVSHATPHQLGFAGALRSFFLAGPGELSAIVAIEQLLHGNPGAVRLSRIAEGGDRLVAALAADLDGRIDAGHVVRRVAQRESSVTVTVEAPSGRRATRNADYVVMTLPPPLLLEVEFSPALPDGTRRALDTLAFGPATKTTMRFEHPWWRRRSWPRAFGTNLPVGAVWDSSGPGRSGRHARPALLTLFAGGAASSQTQRLWNAHGARGLLDELAWLGDSGDEPRGSVQVVWEDERWSRGAYAVFGPGFDPADQPLLSRAAGRVLFAGEHTSETFQGYMNGAVESGERVAAEIAALRRLDRG